MSSLSLISPISSSTLESRSSYSTLLSIRTLDLNQNRCHGKSWWAFQNLLSPTCIELASRRHTKFAAGCLPRQCNQRWRVHANAREESVAGVSNVEDGSAQTTVEQGKRILALQKDLLEQIAERKKLVTAMKQNLGQAAEQVKAYNTNDTKSKGSTELEEQSQQDFVGVKSPMSGDVTSAKEPTDSRGPVSQSNASSEVHESEINSSSTRLFSDYISPSPSKASRVPFPAQDVFISGEKKKDFELVGEAKETVNGQVSHDPVSTDSVSSENEPAPPLAGLNVMNVIIVAAECAPWIKTGGLGDVAGALPKALARRGHRVMVVAPRYSQYEGFQDMGFRKRYNVSGQDLEVGYFHRYIDGVDHVFIDNSMFHGFANNIYGGKREDVLKRMVLFCKAAVEVPWHVPCGGVCYGDGNLVFIANDWHTALLPVYLQAYYRDKGLMEFTRSILVIHNIAHQGRGPLADFSFLGLPNDYIEKFQLYDPIGGEHMNIFKAGIMTAHRVVAVSHGYAWECQTQLGGWGLDGVVRDHNWKLRGIVNGIDDKEWSPELDVHLTSDGYTNYSLETLKSGKALCKAALQRELGFATRSDVPLLGFIGRLDHQKGVDIIADAMPWLMEQDLQLVMLGTGRDDLEDMLRSFEGQHRDKVRGWVGFSVKMAHRITAGCDILLMPSRFEPCGLNQLYAMRFGTIPVVHAVGGLKDTVQAFDPYSNTGTGWTFGKAEAAGLIHALGNALWTFRDFKDSWTDIQKRGMSQDLSWDKAAEQYEEVMVTAKYQW